MVCFQTKNPNLGTFWRALEWKMLVCLWSFGIFYGHLEYFTVIWNILRSFGIFYGHLVYIWPFGNVVVIWYIIPRFGLLCQEKSGNPEEISNLLFNPSRIRASLLNF
jgi:hypothetical protein